MGTPIKKKTAFDYANDYANRQREVYQSAYQQATESKGPQLSGMISDKPSVENKPISDYEYNQNFVNSILKNPMSPEEEERRARSAYAVSSVGALGNAMSAFGNLVFTGMGAPSQKLPTTPDAYGFVKEMQDRNQKDRENYLRYKQLARKSDRDEWAQDQQVRGQQIERYNNSLKSQYDADRRAFDADRTFSANRADAAAARQGQAMNYGAQQYNADEGRALQRRSQDIQSTQWQKQFDANNEHWKATFDQQNGTYPVMSYSANPEMGTPAQYIDINPRKLLSLNIGDVAKSIGDTPEGKEVKDMLKRIRARREELLGMRAKLQSQAEQEASSGMPMMFSATAEKANAVKTQLENLDRMEITTVSNAVRDNKGLVDWLVNSGAATKRKQNGKTINW